MFLNNVRYHCSYRILHRILPVNYYMKKIKTITDDCCNFCKEESETIQHLFVNCRQILVSLWNKLSLHILRNTGKRIVFHVYNVLLRQRKQNCEFYHIYKIIHLFMFETKRKKKDTNFL